MSTAPEDRPVVGAPAAPPDLVPALKWLDRIEEWASVLLLSIVLLAVLTQVVARYVFQAPLFWGDELARYSYVWMAFLAGAFVTGRRSHVTVGLLDGFLSPKHLRLLETLAQSIVALTCMAVVVYSFDWLLKTARPQSPALRVPMIWLYGGVWLSFALMTLHSLLNLAFVATGRIPAVPPLAETFE